MQFTDEELNQARKTNLAAYLSSKGVQLVKNGLTRHKHKEHDSLVFTDNMYNWNSRGEWGNALDYVVRYINSDFKEAVKDLCAFNGTYINITKPEYAPGKTAVNFDINNVEFNESTGRAIGYLTKTRGLNYMMIIDLVKNGLIAQMKDKANVAFLMLNENRKCVGIELNTTISGAKFKQIYPGSKYGYGFNVLNCKPDEVKNYLFFEAPIDALSFKQMYKIPENSILVSMGGLKPGVIKNSIEKFGEGKQKNIYLCADNDRAGYIFCKNIKYKYTGVKLIIPQKEKDWNDVLKKKSVLGKINSISKEQYKNYRENVKNEIVMER